MVAYDLRSPLAAIKMRAYAIERNRQLGEPSVVDWASAIALNIERLRIGA